MNNQSIRRQASDILGVMIPSGKWSETFRELEVSGNLPQRKIIDILLVVLKRLEELEGH